MKPRVSPEGSLQSYQGAEPKDPMVSEIVSV